MRARGHGDAIVAGCEMEQGEPERGQRHEGEGDDPSGPDARLLIRASMSRPVWSKEFEELTAREREVFRLITTGLSNAEIGRELFISETTVKTHVTRVLQKLNLRDRVQAVVLAHQTGLFDTPGP